MQLTKDQLNKIMPKCNADQWLEVLNTAMAQFEIGTPERMAAFLAQLAHESAETTRLMEGLSYSTAERLCAVWPKRFPSAASAIPYVKNPQGLANLVYANRGGNGDAASGDGYRYRGRGLFQLTFRDNYRLAGKALGMPLESDPDSVVTPKVAALTAAHYWHRMGLNALSDHQPDDDDDKDFEQITRRINGGLVGLDERRRYWVQARAVLGSA